MESLKNVTFAEIKVGDTATITRRLSGTEIEALALVGGDVDAFQIGKGQMQVPIMQTKAVGAEALLSGLLQRKLPGPGTSIAAQDLHFEGSMQPGDELVATVTVRQKQEGELVVFDCKVRSDGQELVTGTVTVRAPASRLEYSEFAT